MTTTAFEELGIPITSVYHTELKEGFRMATIYELAEEPTHEQYKILAAHENVEIRVRRDKNGDANPPFYAFIYANE